MTEQQPTTAVEAQTSGAEEERKPVVFAVRIDQALREQIEGLRGITDQSVNEVGIEALNDWVAKTLADETVSAKAMAEIDAEERRLQARRSTIASILGRGAIDGHAQDAAPLSSTSTAKRRKAATPDPEAEPDAKSE